MSRIVEIVTFDPQDPDTYPSVCQSPEEVKQRFGFEGGEELIFDGNGNYLGTLRDRLGDRYTGPEEQG